MLLRKSTLVKTFAKLYLFMTTWSKLKMSGSFRYLRAFRTVLRVHFGERVQFNKNGFSSFF